MICVRCKKEINDAIPEINAENYGGPAYWACPECGKLYVYNRIVVCRPVEDSEYASCKGEDDWVEK